MKLTTINAVYDTLFGNDPDVTDFASVYPDSFIDNESGTIYLLNGAFGYKITIERFNNA